MEKNSQFLLIFYTIYIFVYINTIRNEKKVEIVFRNNLSFSSLKLTKSRNERTTEESEYFRFLFKLNYNQNPRLSRY